MNAAQAASKTQEIINATNLSANSIAGAFAIGQLMRKITVAPGDRLPSNIAGISMVRNAADDSRMWERGEGAVGSDEEIGRYFLDVSHAPFSDSGFPFKSTGSITAGSSVLTCADLAAMVDEDLTDYVVCITNETYGDFYYEITKDNGDDTFDLFKAHPFTESDVTVTVFREATTRINFVDYSEQELTSGSYDVYCWVYPNPLTQDDDIIPFAYPDYLELMTIRRLPETKDRRPVSKTELEKSEAIAKAKEPRQKSPSRPKTAQGAPFSMGQKDSDTYIVRGG